MFFSIITKWEKANDRRKVVGFSTAYCVCVCVCVYVCVCVCLFPSTVKASPD